MQMGTAERTRGSSDTAKIQPVASSTPCTQLSLTEPGEGNRGSQHSGEEE